MWGSTRGLLVVACLAGCADPPETVLLPVDASARDRGVFDVGPFDMLITDAAPDDGVIEDQGVDVDARLDATLVADLDRGIGQGDVFIFEPLADVGVDDPCGSAIDLNLEMAERGGYQSNLAGFPSTTQGSCGGGAGGELLFKYLVGPDETEVVFATDYPATTAPTVLYLRARCDDAEDIACTRGSDAAPGQQLRVSPSGPGLIYLYVDTGSRDGGGPFRLTAGPPEGPVCADGRDNDGDALIDLADPGCLDAADENEGDPPVTPLCADGIDNDEDGSIDYPADMDCPSAGSDGERADCEAAEPCDGPNLGPGFNDGSQTGGSWFAFAWRSQEASEVSALEIFSGEAVGETAIALYSSVNGDPGVQLGRGGFGLQNAVGWQGAQLDMPVRVEADTDYWIVWETVAGAQTPFEQGGVPIVYRGSFDQGATWRDPFQAGVKYRVFCCGL